jgi:two-component system chemotaxis response regulator CheY
MPSEPEARAYRALVVEQSSYFAKLMKHWMADLGFRDVRVCADTDEALLLLAALEFDLVVCDLKSTPINGLALVHRLRRLRGSPNRIKPVVLTSHCATRRRVETARDVGINEFIAKPWSRKVFTQRIMAALLHQRNFIKATSYFGPDRRRTSRRYDGDERRTIVPTKTQIPEEEIAQIDL